MMATDWMEAVRGVRYRIEKHQDGGYWVVRQRFLDADGTELHAHYVYSAPTYPEVAAACRVVVRWIRAGTFYPLPGQFWERRGIR